MFTHYTPHDVLQASNRLKEGYLIAFPTETVYGLGADARNENAVKNIFTAKGRPADHPIIVHLANHHQLQAWARNIPDIAWQLAEQFWPGPLTLILKKDPSVLDIVTGGQDTVGLRVPGHPVAKSLLKAFGDGIAAPSANRFGRVSPTTTAHVAAELGDKIDGILDGGACHIGLESTILDLSGGKPQLLRPGSITPEQLAEVLGAVPSSPIDKAPRASGTLADHYAPCTPVYLVPPNRVQRTLEYYLQQGEKVAVMGRQTPLQGSIHWHAMPHTPTDYARQLYASLRQLDALNCHCILVEEPPTQHDWQAINDRLQRAASFPDIQFPTQPPARPIQP